MHRLIPLTAAKLATYGNSNQHGNCKAKQCGDPVHGFYNIPVIVNTSEVKIKVTKYL